MTLDNAILELFGNIMPAGAGARYVAALRERLGGENERVMDLAAVSCLLLRQEGIAPEIAEACVRTSVPGAESSMGAMCYWIIVDGTYLGAHMPTREWWWSIVDGAEVSKDVVFRENPIRQRLLDPLALLSRFGIEETKNPTA